MQIDISKEYVNHVSFDSAVKNGSEDPIACACEHADLSNWSEYCGMTYTFTVKADSEEELEEKTMELISDVEHKAKNHVIHINYDGEVEIKGFDFEAIKTRTRRHYENITCYGGESRSLSDFFNGAIQNNYLEFEDEETGCDMVLFFDNWNDCFEGETEERIEWLKDDFPLNEVGIKYGLEEKAYGDITILTKDFASSFVDFSDD